MPPNKTWWMKVDIQSFLPADTTIVFYPGFQNYVQVYYAAGGRYSRIAVCGNMFPASQLNIPDFRQATLLPVTAQQLTTFYISIKNVTTYQVDAFKPYLMSKASLDNLQVRLLQNNRIPHAVFFTGIGMFVIMLIYILIKWLYQKDATYGYYAITIFGSMAYFLFNFFKEQNNQLVFTEKPMLIHLIADSFIFLSIFAYWHFVRRFLYLSKEKAFLGRFMYYGSFAVLIAGLASLWYAFTFKNITGLIQLNSTIGVIFLLAGFYILISIRKMKQPLKWFIYGGIFCLVLFYSLGSFYEMIRDTQWNFFPNFLGGGTPLLMIGNVFEMLFFTIGLAYRSKLEVEAVAGISVQKAEAEMKALRAQMNPHFIFNCMHTIDAYIFKEQPEKASAFLNKFSKLIRQTLENSQYPLISLDKEMESLQLYITLEEERFENTFTTRFDIPKQLLDQHFKIPPLLLQPYAENAIQHGLRHLPVTKTGTIKEQGRLTVQLSEEADKIVITIADNGIGRTASQQLKATNGRTHESLALTLTKQRLETLPGNGTVEIRDTKNGDEMGTQVIIHLPKIK